MDADKLSASTRVHRWLILFSARLWILESVRAQSAFSRPQGECDDPIHASLGFAAAVPVLWAGRNLSVTSFSFRELKWLHLTRLLSIPPKWARTS